MQIAMRRFSPVRGADAMQDMAGCHRIGSGGLRQEGGSRRCLEAGPMMASRRGPIQHGAGLHRILGLLLIGLIGGCVTGSPELARQRMTGFEREMADKLALIHKGMTHSDVVGVLGKPDDGALGQDAFRYMVWSLHPVFVLVNEPVESSRLPYLLLEPRTRTWEGCRFNQQYTGGIPPVFSEGYFTCLVASTPELERLRDVLVQELPPQAELYLPSLRADATGIAFRTGKLVIKSESPAYVSTFTIQPPLPPDCVAKIDFSKGVVTGVYLIHPAPSKRGAFYFTVVE
jgi:hypothetical protein